MFRELDLIDVWFDSGSMPYAQWHYPFENKEYIDNKRFFPADFIAEGVDQTRGWFYTLHAISSMVFDSVSYKNVVSNDDIWRPEIVFQNTLIKRQDIVASQDVITVGTVLFCKNNEIYSYGESDIVFAEDNKHKVINISKDQWKQSSDSSPETN